MRGRARRLLKSICGFWDCASAIYARAHYLDRPQQQGGGGETAATGPARGTKAAGG